MWEDEERFTCGCQSPSSSQDVASPCFLCSHLNILIYQPETGTVRSVCGTHASNMCVL